MLNLMSLSQSISNFRVLMVLITLVVLTSALGTVFFFIPTGVKKKLPQLFFSPWKNLREFFFYSIFLPGSIFPGRSSFFTPFFTRPPQAKIFYKGFYYRTEKNPSLGSFFLSFFFTRRRRKNLEFFFYP